MRLYRVRAASSGWLGGPGLNTFYFVAGLVNPDGAASDALLCANRVRTAFFDGLIAFPSVWTMTVSPTVDVIDAPTGALVNSFSVAPPATLVGTGLNSFHATALCMLLQLRTTSVIDGSRVMGRAFIGPHSAGNDPDGTPQAGLLTAARAIGTALMDPGGGPNLAVWHRPRKAAAGPPIVTARAGAHALVTSTTVPDKWAVLRSRRD